MHAKKDFKYTKKSTEFFKELEASSYPFMSKLEKPYRRNIKLNDYWINLHKN